MIKKQVDVLIIGAGPAGCVSAAYLNNQGLSVQIIEKNKFPRFVIGESLLPISMDHFEEVGLLKCLKTKNFEKKYGARFIRNNEVCHFDFSKKFTEGWNWTWQVPRADFDKTLTDELEILGVDIQFETAVTEVNFKEDKALIKAESMDGSIQVTEAKFVIDASGFGRVLPRLLDLDCPTSMPSHSSIFTHVDDIRKPEGTEGTLITFDVVRQDVWLWVIPFSNGTTSLGFVGPTEFIESFEGNSQERFDQLLALSNFYSPRFSHLKSLFEPKQIKNFSTAVSKLYGERFVITGNSSEFLDPVFSSGVAFATSSGLLAAKLISRKLKGENIDWETEYKETIQKGVDVFRSYINEWYSGNLQKVFFHQPENKEIKEKICAVLAGYVWDETNPFVKKHNRVINSMAHLIDLEVASMNKS